MVESKGRKRIFAPFDSRTEIPQQPVIKGFVLRRQLRDPRRDIGKAGLARPFGKQPGRVGSLIFRNSAAALLLRQTGELPAEPVQFLELSGCPEKGHNYRAITI
jgi:hypothetical protein